MRQLKILNNPSTFLATATLVALLLHISLIALVEPAHSPARRIVKPMQLRFYSPSQDLSTHPDGIQETLADLSPTLFALPNISGFSQALMCNQPTGYKFSLHPLRAEETHLSTFKEMDAKNEDQSIFPFANTTSTWDQEEPQSVFHGNTPDYPKGVQLELSPNLKTALLSTPNLDAISLPAREEVSAQLQVGPFGNLEELFFDPQTLPSQEIANQLFRELHSLKFSPAKQPRRGRVTLYSLETQTEAEDD